MEIGLETAAYEENLFEILISKVSLKSTPEHRPFNPRFGVYGVSESGNIMGETYGVDDNSAENRSSNSGTLANWRIACGAHHRVVV